MNMHQDDIYKLLRRYEAPTKIELDKAVDAILDLKKRNEISDEIAKRLVRLLISKYISDEIRADIYSSFGIRSNPLKLKFMGFRYGKTTSKEAYAS